MPGGRRRRFELIKGCKKLRLRLLLRLLLLLLALVAASGRLLHKGLGGGAPGRQLNHRKAGPPLPMVGYLRQAALTSHPCWLQRGRPAASLVAMAVLLLLLLPPLAGLNNLGAWHRRALLLLLLLLVPGRRSVLQLGARVGAWAAVQGGARQGARRHRRAAKRCSKQGWGGCRTDAPPWLLQPGQGCGRLLQGMSCCMQRAGLATALPRQRLRSPARCRSAHQVHSNGAARHHGIKAATDALRHLAAVEGDGIRKAGGGVGVGHHQAACAAGRGAAGQRAEREG